MSDCRIAGSCRFDNPATKTAPDLRLHKGCRMLPDAAHPIRSLLPDSPYIGIRQSGNGKT